MFKFCELYDGPHWHTIKDGFPRLSAAEAYALDWFKSHGYEIVDRDATFASATDVKRGIDYMTSKGDAFYQFCVEESRA